MRGHSEDRFTWGKQLQPAPKSPFCAYTHSTEISLCWFNNACIRTTSRPWRLVWLLRTFIFLLVGSVPVFHYRTKNPFRVLYVTRDTLAAVTACRWGAAVGKHRQKATEISSWPLSERPLNLHGWKETWQCSGAESVGTRQSELFSWALFTRASQKWWLNIWHHNHSLYL